MVMATVTMFAHKKPQGEELDKAAPLRKGEGNAWQCPFCGQDDFPELTEVWNHFDAGTCPGKAVGVKIRLDNGVAGFIQVKNLSDSHVLKPEERVQIRQSIYCRIIKINPEKFSIDAICKSSALEDKEGEWKPQKDSYYDFDEEARDKNQYVNERKKAQAKQSYVKRVIVHPNFKNIEFKRAERILDNREKDKSDVGDVDYSQGDCIIRPSSKGQDHLTVTWKVTDGIHQHIDVLEKNKVNAFSLGQSLWIGNEEFEDLDEIIARHITPMASHSRDILSFKYFRSDTDGGNKTKCESMIIAEKRANPSKIHYFFSASKELSGKFMLTYMPRDKVRHEFVTVTPDGFRFRRQNFESLMGLMKWFKEHFRDPIPGTPASPGNRTSRTPYGGTTPGGRTGGGITPGAMSMAGANTPYGQTPGFGRSAPYTPTANTPFMTPYNTPGPATTPRANFAGGSGTPRSYGGATPRGGTTPRQQGGMTPRREPGGKFPPPSPSQGGRGGHKSKGGDMWGAAAEAWSGGGRGRRTPGQGRGGYNSTPHYDDQRTPRYGSGGSRTPGGGRTPQERRGDRQTPRGHFGDATPLYDE